MKLFILIALLLETVLTRHETLNLMHVIDRLNISHPDPGSGVYQSVALRPFYYMKQVITFM